MPAVSTNCVESNLLGGLGVVVVALLVSLKKFEESVTNRSDVAAELPASKTISIRTNLALAARFQIPTGSGVFLLHGDRELTDRNITGVLISSTVHRKRR